MNEPRHRLATFLTCPERFEILDSTSRRVIRPIWQIDARMMQVLLPIICAYSQNFELPDLQLAAIDRYISDRLALEPNLVDRVVAELYYALTRRSSMFEASNRVWKNYIGNTAVKLVVKYWNDLPPSYQDEELFYELINVDFFTVDTLFSGFDLNHQPELDRDFDLLKRIDIYARPKLWNCIRSHRRKVDRYFGLSNWGVVSRSSKLYVRLALNGVMSSHRLQLDVLLASVFKDYLRKTGFFQDDDDRQQVHVNKLRDNDWLAIANKCQAHITELNRVDWEIIRTECERDNCHPSLDPRSLAVEFIKDELNWIGNRIRQYIPVPRQPKQEPDLSRLFPIVYRSISRLNAEDRQIVDLYFRDGLNQKNIEQLVGIDQSTVSRRLGTVQLWGDVLKASG
jgi:hypothetical protein